MKLERIAFYGRSLEEYRLIYGLDDETVTTKRIVDLAAGSASFAAEVNHLGGNVVAVDPYYESDVATLERECAADIDRIAAALPSVAHKYDFSFYGDRERRVDYARAALARFVADYPTGREEGRYVAGSLPSLPFSDDAFDMALMGHFIITYADRFTETFVETALREALRVAGEVIVYPLLTLAGRSYAPLSAILDRLGAGGIDHRIEETNFVFQKGADCRLRLTKPPGGG